MSLDEQAEEALYRALSNVSVIPRKQEQERIFKAAIRRVMEYMNWTEIKLDKGEPK